MRSQKLTEEVNTTKFYQKASFPWAIIVLAIVAFVSFATGTHTERLNQQIMQQEFENGAASVKK